MRSKGTVGKALLAMQLIILAAQAFPIEAAGPRRQAPPVCSRYTLPPALLKHPFIFAGEQVPLDRSDVRHRIQYQINFLLFDARSVLTGWLMNINRYSWIFDEVFTKQGIPKDFTLFSPVVSGLDPHSSNRIPGAGWWALTSKCGPAEGVPMSVDAWHDDRLDLDLSTRCFAAQLKSIRKELQTKSWITAASAYVATTKELAERVKTWKTDVYWDLPLPESAESLIPRWIALKIIYDWRSSFGITIQKAKPMAFDQVSGLILAKDLAVAVIAQMTDTSPLVILRMNPKIVPSKGILPANVKGKRVTHTLAAPRGKGGVLVKKLQKGGYLAPRR